MTRNPSRRFGLSNRERLELFVLESDRLDGHKLVQSGFSPKLNFSMEGPDQPLEYKISEPEPEVLESYLLRLRKFMSSDEPLFVHGVRNLARTLLPESELRDQLDDAHREWSRQMKNAQVSIRLNDNEIFPSYAWDLYVNGTYFHLDQSKREKLRLFADSGAEWMIRWQFLNQIVYASHYVFEISLVVESAMRENVMRFDDIDH